jgi:CRP-like cAMP-binding protein
MVPDATGAAGLTLGQPRHEPLAPWADAAPARVLARGEALYRVGERAAVVYVVEAGLLTLAISSPTGRDRLIGIAGPGDLLGALDPGADRYGETAQALGAAVAVRALDPRFGPRGDAVAGALGDQARRLRQALEDVDLPVAARLARALARLGERFGQRTEDGAVRLTLPLTHEHLAALVGAARETTTLTLSDLRRRGLVEGTRGRYRFDPARLRDAAHGPLLN